MMTAEKTVRCGNRVAHKGFPAHHETVAQVRLCFARGAVASIEEAAAVAAEVARVEAEAAEWSQADCEHGLSASLCAGPGHYPADGPEENYSTSQLMSITSSQYHARGEGCPWDCSHCPGNVEADAYERSAEMAAEAEAAQVPSEPDLAAPDPTDVMAALTAAGLSQSQERAESAAALNEMVRNGKEEAAAAPGLLYDGIYTLEGEGEHRTFRVRTQGADADFAPGKTVIGFLSGPDNERDYTGFGFVFDGPLTSRVAVWKKHKANTALIAAAEKLAANPEAALKEAKCRRCHRTLTVPASIHNGLGPECAKKGL